MAPEVTNYPDHPVSNRGGQEFESLRERISTPFEITTVSLQKLRISGVFATDDPQAFIAFMRSLPGVKVTATATRVLFSQL